MLFRRLRKPARLLGTPLILLWLCLAAAGQAADTNPPPPVPFHILAQRWETAEALFRSDPRWLGGDGAMSVDLGNGRVLWLFGDSFVDPAQAGSRPSTALVRNSVAIQSGYDPTAAGIQFFWSLSGAQATAFFPHAGERWFWPSSGIVLGGRLLVFLVEIEPAATDLGFQACGWQAVRIDNPQDTPDRWRRTYLDSPPTPGFIVGTGSPVLADGWLHAFATENDGRALYLLRWPEEAAAEGKLDGARWWAGEAAGWVPRPNGGALPRAVSTDGQMEFSVTYVSELNRWLQVQTLSLAVPCLAVASAPALTGPWSTPTCFYDPPEKGAPGLLIYAGKAHPALAGAELAFTYVVNTTRENRLLEDLSIYFPVVVRGLIETAPASPGE